MVAISVNNEAVEGRPYFWRRIMSSYNGMQIPSREENSEPLKTPRKNSSHRDSEKIVVEPRDEDECIVSTQEAGKSLDC